MMTAKFTRLTGTWENLVTKTTRSLLIMVLGFRCISTRMTKMAASTTQRTNINFSTQEIRSKEHSISTKRSRLTTCAQSTFSSDAAMNSRISGTLPTQHLELLILICPTLQQDLITKLGSKFPVQVSRTLGSLKMISPKILRLS